MPCHATPPWTDDYKRTTIHDQVDIPKRDRKESKIKKNKQKNIQSFVLLFFVLLWNPIQSILIRLIEVCLPVCLFVEKKKLYSIWNSFETKFYFIRKFSKFEVPEYRIALLFFFLLFCLFCSRLQSLFIRHSILFG